MECVNQNFEEITGFLLEIHVPVPPVQGQPKNMNWNIIGANFLFFNFQAQSFSLKFNKDSIRFETVTQQVVGKFLKRKRF